MPWIALARGSADTVGNCLDAERSSGPSWLDFTAGEVRAGELLQGIDSNVRRATVSRSPLEAVSAAMFTETVAVRRADGRYGEP